MIHGLLEIYNLNILEITALYQLWQCLLQNKLFYGRKAEKCFCYIMIILLLFLIHLFPKIAKTMSQNWRFQTMKKLFISSIAMHFLFYSKFWIWSHASF